MFDNYELQLMNQQILLSGIKCVYDNELNEFQY